MKKTEAIIDELQGKITNGTYKTGDRLPSEASLCREYNVSRITVRAAIQDLAGRGLVKSVRGQGTTVISNVLNITDSNFFCKANLEQLSRIDVFEFRKIIEVESAGIAATRADASDIEAFNEINENMGKATSTDEMVKYDLAFHERIANATKNPILIGLFYAMFEPYKKLFIQNFNHVGVIDTEGHKKIVFAIESCDVEGAKMLMINHINKTVVQTQPLNKK